MPPCHTNNERSLITKLLLYYYRVVDMFIKRPTYLGISSIVVYLCMFIYASVLTVLAFWSEFPSNPITGESPGVGKHDGPSAKHYLLGS